MSDFTRLRSHGEASLYVDKERAARIATTMLDARAAGHMSQRGAERLNGKLTFALSYVAGSLGLSMSMRLVVGIDEAGTLVGGLVTCAPSILVKRYR